MSDRTPLEKQREKENHDALQLIANRLRQIVDLLTPAGNQAGSEPDPAEVEELTRILRRITPGMADPSGGDYKTAVVRPFAEAALRWFRDKQQRGDGRDG